MNLPKLRQNRTVRRRHTHSLVVLVALQTALMITPAHAAGIEADVSEAGCGAERYYDTAWYACRPCGENAESDGKSIFATSDDPIFLILCFF